MHISEQDVMRRIFRRSPLCKMCATRRGASDKVQHDASKWTSEQIWYSDVVLWAEGSARIPLFALNRTAKCEGQKWGSSWSIVAKKEADAWNIVQIAKDGGISEARMGRRTEVEHVSEHQRMEALLQSKLSLIFEALTCIPQYMSALRYPCSWPWGYRLPFPGYRPILFYFFPTEIQYFTRWISYIYGTFFGPSANCRRIEITVGLPFDGWKFGPAMRGNPLADNELPVSFPRPHTSMNGTYKEEEPVVIYVCTDCIGEITGWNSRLQEIYRSF